jgi:hypothetical protein
MLLILQSAGVLANDSTIAPGWVTSEALHTWRMILSGVIGDKLKVFESRIGRQNNSGLRKKNLAFVAQCFVPSLRVS